MVKCEINKVVNRIDGEVEYSMTQEYSRVPAVGETIIVSWYGDSPWEEEVAAVTLLPRSKDYGTAAWITVVTDRSREPDYTDDDIMGGNRDQSIVEYHTGMEEAGWTLMEFRTCWHPGFSGWMSPDLANSCGIVLPGLDHY